MLVELKTLLAALDIPADWVGLRAIRETSTTRSARDGRPETNGTSFTQGVMVEVLVQGQIGYTATNLITLTGVQAAAQSAYRQAIAASEWHLHPTPLAARPMVKGEYTSPLRQPFDLLSAKAINETLIQLCQTLKVDDRIVQASATIITTETESWFVSSNGSAVTQHFFRIGTDYTATAQAGPIVQRRSHHGWLASCYQGGMEYFITPDLWQQVRVVGEQAVELLTAAECPTETTNLLLAPDQMLLQIHESVGHPLELDRILGDERNYAGGSFVRPADFGDRVYGSPLMNITFDPTVAGEFASYDFDDTGAPAQREYLIQGGVLLRGLGSLESQARTGAPGVACARAANWNRPPIDRMANLNLEPGTATLEQMISGIERGVYMESNRSWSIDDQRYKFQFSCEYGRLIEQGQLTKTLRNPNYRGTTPQFWGNLILLGDRSTWQMYGTPNCGKGEPNQAIWVGHGAPVALFKDIEVFGGGV
jgi:predicted Zn-dependent protease